MDGSAFRDIGTLFKAMVLLGILILCGSIAVSYFLGRQSMSKYKADWQTQPTAFWNEVLVGRKITSIAWEGEKISAVVLDSGEKLGVKMNERGEAVFFIED